MARSKKPTLESLTRDVAELAQGQKYMSLQLWVLLSQGERIMATQQEHAAELDKVTAQIAKIGVETGKTLQKVIDLEQILVDGPVTSPAVDVSLAALKAQAQLTDDMVPDVAPPTA